MEGISRFYICLYHSINFILLLSLIYSSLLLQNNSEFWQSTVKEVHTYFAHEIQVQPWKTFPRKLPIIWKHTLMNTIFLAYHHLSCKTNEHSFITIWLSFGVKYFSWTHAASSNSLKYQQAYNDECKLWSITNIVFYISIGNDNPKDLYSTLYV